MPNYGDAHYWNKRYQEDADSPFDWLFDFKDLQSVLEHLLPQKDLRILLVGAGNAPFSPDFHRIGGYTKLVNIDLSDVVIAQQAEKYPEQTWLVMDVLHMTFPDASIPAVVDKSLIDTLLCYNESAKNTQLMIDELYRVLAPGSRYITFSLHSIEEVIGKFSQEKFDWKVSAYRVKSSRWNEHEHRRRAVAHTMIVCDRPFADGSFPAAEYPLQVPGVLSEEEYLALKGHADNYNLTYALMSANTLLLRTLLYGVLAEKDAPSKGTLSVWRREDLFLSSRYMLNEYLNIRAGLEKYDFAVALDKAILSKEINLSEYLLNATESNHSATQDSY